MISKYGKKKVPDFEDEDLQHVGEGLALFLRSTGISNNGPPEITQNELSTFLREKCRVILDAVLCAQSTKQESKECAVSETRYRQTWDDLLYICLNCKEHSVSTM